MAVITYHTILSGCPKGEPECWKEFARGYSPYATFVLEHSFPELKQDVAGHVDRIFAKTREGDFFQAFQGRREREFLLHFRELVCDYGWSLTKIPETLIDREMIAKITDGFSLIQREILWASLKGIDISLAHAILRVDESTVTEVFQKANANLRGLMDRWSENTLAGSGQSLLRAVRDWGGQECLDNDTYGKIVDGQISWRDREKAEQHVRSCFYCIDRFTSYQEVVYCLRKLPAAAEADVSRILAAVGISTEEERKGLLSKLFSKSHAM